MNMKNKKGLSGIVTMLIIILLVLAAVGLIWQPISDMLGGGTDAMAKSNMCLGLDVKITKIVPSGENYDVTVSRTPTGPEAAMTLKYVFSSETESGEPVDGTTEWVQLKTDTETVAGGISGATKLKAYPVFTDEETGEEITCENPVERDIN